MIEGTGGLSLEPLAALQRLARSVLGAARPPIAIGGHQARAPAHVLGQAPASPRSILYSFELIPPKNEEKLDKWVKYIAPQVRGVFDFLTIVDKATRHEPVEVALTLRKHFAGNIIPHLTLRDRTRREIEEMITRARESGVTKFLALKGDTPPSGKFSDVCELIAFLKEGGMEVGAALNQRSDSPERTKQKLASGATFFITQPVWAIEELDPMLRAKLLTLVPTLLVLADHQKLAEYASRYPEMGISESYLAQHARAGSAFALVYAKKLKQKLEAQNFTWLHFMGNLNLILNLS